MNDMSSVYADFQGVGSVIAAKLAVDDFSAKLGVPVEIISADHQNKPDVGAAIARRWFDSESVDVIMDLPNSAVALAVLAIATEKNKAVIGSGAGTSVLTGPKCAQEFRPLDLRHLCARPQPRQGADRAGRQDLVLHHRRLRLRQGPGRQLRGGGRGGGRQGAGRGAPSAQHLGLLLVPAAGAGLGRRRRRLRQRGRRPQHLAQAGA